MNLVSKQENCRKEFTRDGSKSRNRWGVILAGGDGTRLRSLTRSITGDERPKQFCPILSGSTLLEQTRNRVASTIREDQTFLVVTQAHERFYNELPNTELLVQPQNKGTAPAIIYALSRIARKSPDAVVAFFPSDHHFTNNETFMSHVEAAFDSVDKMDAAILLGMTPEGPEVGYGWIEPHPSILRDLPRAISRVRRFWEKPSRNLAKDLMRRDCLWNSFVMVGRVDAFLRMARRALPKICDLFSAITPSFETPGEFNELRKLYLHIPSIDFSREVLGVSPDDLAVMKVCDVGWSDLGEPSRVLNTLARFGTQAQLVASAG
jgi:mannose-1-phosphate guanylyltransferase